MSSRMVLIKLTGRPPLAPWQCGSIKYSDSLGIRKGIYCILSSGNSSPTKPADRRFRNRLVFEDNYTVRAVLEKGAGWRIINREERSNK